MKLISMVVFAWVIVNPIQVTAQQWSPQQQEVMDFTRACWDDWQAERVEPYLSDCWEDDITFWWSEFSLPFGKEWVQQAKVWFADSDLAQLSVQFHKVIIHGDVAVLNYQLLGSDRGPDGKLQMFASGRTDVLHRHDGRWKVIAVHQHPGPVSRGGSE